MFLKLYTNLYKTDMHKQASFVALNCLTAAKSLYNTSQINSWGYYLWFHFLRLRRGTCRPFHSRVSNVSN